MSVGYWACKQLCVVACVFTATEFLLICGLSRGGDSVQVSLVFTVR